MFVSEKTFFSIFFSRNVDCNFDNPGERISWNFKMSQQKPKTNFEKFFVQKKDFSSTKTSWHVHFLFDKISGITHRNSGKIFSLRIPKHSYKELWSLQSVCFCAKNSFRQLQCTFDNLDKEFPQNDCRYSSRSPKKCKKERFSKNISPGKVSLTQWNVA